MTNDQIRMKKEGPVSNAPDNHRRSGTTLSLGFSHFFAIRVSAFVISVLAGVDLHASSTNAPTELVILQGASGEKQYEPIFSAAAQDWVAAAEKAGRRVKIFSPESSGTNTMAQFTAFLGQQPTNGVAELWIVLIGHGTFDGAEAKFNLQGPDLSADDLARLFEPFSRPIILIDCTSSSAPFLKKLSGEHRVIVTATKSGWEENFTRFGKYLAKALTDTASDLDKDGQISVLEAFLIASRQTQEFYKQENRLATEHALIDDNGDGLGTPADFFRGVRAVKTAEEKASPDGLRAHQIHFVRGTEEQKLSLEMREKRNQLEHELEELRRRKSEMSDEEYLKRLEPIVTEIARLYHSIDRNPAEKH